MPIHRRQRQQRHQLSGQRRTVQYGIPYGERPGDELYPHMLIEDIGHHLMPLGRRWTEREYGVELVPPSERFEALLTDALEPEGHEGLTDAVSDFMRESAQIAMQYGRAVYEIVYLTDANGEVAAIDLAFVPPRSIHAEGDVLVQRVPDEVVADRAVPAEIRVPRRDLLVLDSPLKPKRGARMFDALAHVTRPELPEFVEQQIRGETQIGYSTAEDIRFDDLAVAEVTREIGWDARSDLAGKETFLEFYKLVRRLRFERFLALFRKQLLEQLNSQLRVIGDAVGESGQLVITGMPTEADVEAAQASLERGESDFGNLLTPFSLA